MRISRKIALSISVLFVVAILILVMGLVNLGRVNGIVQRVATVSAPRVVVSGEIRNILRENDLAQRNILLLTKQSEREQIAGSLPAIQKRMTDEFAKLERLGGKQDADKSRQAWNNLMEVNKERDFRQGAPQQRRHGEGAVPWRVQRRLCPMHHCARPGGGYAYQVQRLCGTADP